MTNRDIVASLKALRLSAGLTQAEIAERLGKGGYTQTVVSKIETNERNVGISLLTQWAAACGYDVQISFTLSGSQPDGDEILPMPEDISHEVARTEG